MELRTILNEYSLIVKAAHRAVTDRLVTSVGVERGPRFRPNNFDIISVRFDDTTERVVITARTVGGSSRHHADAVLSLDEREFTHYLGGLS